MGAGPLGHVIVLRSRPMRISFLEGEMAQNEWISAACHQDTAINAVLTLY